MWYRDRATLDGSVLQNCRYSLDADAFRWYDAWLPITPFPSPVAYHTGLPSTDLPHRLCTLYPVWIETGFTEPYHIDVPFLSPTFVSRTPPDFL